MRPTPDIIGRHLGDSAVLIQMRTGRIYELNETGARIWALLEAGASRDEVVAAIAAEFAVEHSDAVDAVDRLIDALRAEGLLLP